MNVEHDKEGENSKEQLDETPEHILLRIPGLVHIYNVMACVFYHDGEGSLLIHPAKEGVILIYIAGLPAHHPSTR